MGELGAILLAAAGVVFLVRKVGALAFLVLAGLALMVASGVLGLVGR